MTRLGLKNFVRWKLGITNDDWSDADMLVVANLKLGEICEKITEAHQGYFGVYSLFNLVASGSDVAKREYPLPDDILNNLYKVELKLDGTNWIPADRVHLIPGKDFRLQESWITANYSNSYPKYAVFRNSLWILSGEIKNVTGGGRLWYINYPDPLPDLTNDTIDMSEATNENASVPVGFPKMFHEILARAMILEYKGKNTLPLTDREPMFDQDLEEKIKRLRGQDLDEVITAEVQDTGDGSQY